MPAPSPGSDDERLPWLEPYSDTAVRPAAPAKASKRGAAKIAAGIAALVAAVTAGYYVGQREPGRQAIPADIAPPPAIVPVRQTAPATVAPALPAAPITVEPAPVPAKVSAKVPKKPVRRAAGERRIRSAGVESARLRQVRAAQDRASPRRPSARSWPKMPSPGPAGQVIQLGAFRTPAGANAAYRMRLGRYPLLGRMPRVVVPVVTKPRGQILYVLRLGTSSRQQSAIVCRNLRASGDHCLVIG